MSVIEKTIVLTVAKDGRYLRLNRCKKDFLEIVQYRECSDLQVDINSLTVRILNSLHVYNDPHLGAMSSPELSAALINNGLHAKDKLVAKLIINSTSHKYSIIGKLSKF